MFLKAFGLLTPLAAGGVWVAGGFDGAVAPAGDESALIAESASSGSSTSAAVADPETCRNITLEWGRAHAGEMPNVDPNDVAASMGATLATAGKFKGLDDELKRAGCPSIIKEAMNVASGKFATDLAEEMEKDLSEPDESGGGWGEDTPE
jgi:hypothetical protein